MCNCFTFSIFQDSSHQNFGILSILPNQITITRQFFLTRLKCFFYFCNQVTIASIIVLFQSIIIPLADLQWCYG